MLFVRHELRSEHPLIELRMFSQHAFRLAMGIYAFVQGAQYARLVFIPLQLEGLRGLSALRVGMMFFVPAILTGLGMSIGGRLVDRIGPRRHPIGCSGMFVAVFSFSRLTLTTPVWAIVTLLSLQGLGMGITVAPSMVAGVGDLPARLSHGAAVAPYRASRSAVVAVAVLGAVVTARMGDDPTAQEAQEAYNSAFLVTAAGILVALVLARRLPRRTIDHPVPVSAEAAFAIERRGAPLARIAVGAGG